MSTTEYKQFLVSFDASTVPELYADWQWLLDPKTLAEPVAMTCFGDLFFKHNDAIYFLDSLEGSIRRFTKDADSLDGQLRKPANQELLLSAETVTLLRAKNLTLKPDELYIYVPHPLLGGSVDLGSVQVMSMRAVISLNGQALAQAH